MKKPLIPTHPEILARFDALDVKANWFEAEHKFPKCFISHARRGKYGGKHSAALWKRFSLAIDKQAGVERAELIPAQETSQALVDAIRGCKSSQACDGLINRILEGLADESIDGNKARALVEALREKRQILEDVAEQEEQAKAGEELTVRVVFTNDWQSREKQ